MSVDQTSPIKRCAIYTRKSSNQRLDHDVNSLVTQREICSAYIKSQQYKGWVELTDRYDDGGHSGSGLERPALAQLMHDIEAGKVDAVVVYKIDRLTRSLFDFVRLIEIFDRQNITLTSISQAFDTSDSMGRMILNILLTFSQFERELISERTRDSLRTRKKHGLVHGGLPPFGYISTKDGLSIDKAEAAIVRFIFKKFLQTRRYTAVMTAVREAGYCSSVKLTKQGNARGGTLMSAGTVYGIIRNPIYVGEIRGIGTTYKGIHEPIISQEDWEAAQALSAKRKKRPADARDTKHFLAGLLWDDLGRKMRLDLNWHRGKTYCAYVSSNAYWSQREYRRAYRCNADNLDTLIFASVCDFFSDRGRLRSALKGLGVYDDELHELSTRGKAAAIRLNNTPSEKLEELFAALIYKIEVGEERLAIYVRSLELRRFLLWDNNSIFRGRPADWPCSDTRYEFEVAARTVTAERWPSLHIKPQSNSQVANPDKKLVNLVQRARKAQRLVEEHREWSIEELAHKQNCRPTFFARLIRLNYLAPDIVTAILDGTQPTTLTRKIVLESNIPTDWAIQRQLFGFSAPERRIAPQQLFGRGMWPTATK
ncbi:recombinase family protein [Parasphingorhabdus flavimaris]|uniref:Recombinase family protein n=1 Tax=Parasphingorhabdus flavimaris TaxID=266812 RepID=A0ABX2N4N4_9SPHN|nr:recombinase family protein [Parasphingorhabdus flavimaris]NVD28642.1 recombinase family protein [Parasphingorhabdus flavimaris]